MVLAKDINRNALPALKPCGRLVIVERDPQKTGYSSSESTAREVLIGQMEEAGFTHTKTDTGLLENDNIYFFTIRKQIDGVNKFPPHLSK